MLVFNFLLDVDNHGWLKVGDEDEMASSSSQIDIGKKCLRKSPNRIQSGQKANLSESCFRDTVNVAGLSSMSVFKLLLDVDVVVDIGQVLRMNDKKPMD